MAYTSETMPSEYRSTVMLLMGSAFSMANIVIPGIAMVILPLEWSWWLTESFGKFLKESHLEIGCQLLYFSDSLLERVPNYHGLIEFDLWSSVHLFARESEVSHVPRQKRRGSCRVSDHLQKEPSQGQLSHHFPSQ